LLCPLVSLFTCHFPSFLLLLLLLHSFVDLFHCTGCPSCRVIDISSSPPARTADRPLYISSHFCPMVAYRETDELSPLDKITTHSFRALECIGDSLLLYHIHTYTNVAVLMYSPYPCPCPCPCRPRRRNRAIPSSPVVTVH